MPPGVEAIDYMPSQLQNLPAHLRRSAVMVLHHSFAGIGDREFKITLDALRKYDLWAGRENAAEIGRHLGWELE
jgi:hypothetical protein